MRGAWVIAVVAASGCSSILGIDEFKLGDAGTPGGDARDGAAGYCVGPLGWQVCLPMAPTMPLELSGGELDVDTDIGAACLDMQPAAWKELQPDGTSRQPDACFIVASSITLGGGISGRGIRPLVLVAADTIAITSSGFVDVDHLSDFSAGTPACTGGASGQNGMPGQGGGGGAGGSFLTGGGSGGTSSSGPLGGIPAEPTGRPQLLTPGCPGTAGGASGGNVGGGPGIGGGAVYLLAGNRITIDGYVNASGAGGRPGGLLTGGGGGGSGGMIVLHAPAIAGSGFLVANGGGGAGGGGGNVVGQPGMEPDPTMPNRGALGGGSQVGGRGGNGFAAGMPATSGEPGSPTTAAAGGGGGGGGGYIRANTTPGNTISSPGVMVVP